MGKVFNVTADCKPALHYMVDLTKRLKKIREMVDRGEYFTINRARQYGKTTILKALNRYLQNEYMVVSLDFQKFSYHNFQNEKAFVQAFSGELAKKLRDRHAVPAGLVGKMLALADGTVTADLMHLFMCFSEWCAESEKPVVMLIDEVDSATNNQVFLDFLSQLRAGYIDRDEMPAFQSVILAGVYDVKNIKRKIRQDDDHKVNSPWNIAADFLIDMSFSAVEIAGMLSQYEADYHTGMDIQEIAELIYDYTSGYPFLVSKICKLIDERIYGTAGYPDKKSAWTRAGFLEAVKLLLGESNTLFDSLINKLEDYPELDEMLRELLFDGKEIAYVIGVRSVEMALMFGFVRREKNNVVIANRIFETLLYNLFLASPAMRQNSIYDAGLIDKNQFLRDGHLNMKLILEKFVMHFNDLYGDQSQSFYEEDGRRYFLLYLRPIINGTGNYYIESRTRNMERTDVIVDYLGEQFVIELKVWRGNSYNERGEAQLAEYLEHYHLKKGYMISYNFNKKKSIGVKEIVLGDKILVEATV